MEAFPHSAMTGGIMIYDLRSLETKLPIELAFIHPDRHKPQNNTGRLPMNHDTPSTPERAHPSSPPPKALRDGEDAANAKPSALRRHPARDESSEPPQYDAFLRIIRR